MNPRDMASKVKRRLIKGLFLVKCYTIVLMHWYQPGLGQDINPYFEFLDIKNGMSHNTVYAITQDKNNYMWFGTENGLNRFDGINMKVYSVNYKDSLSISHNHIRVLYTDSRDQLWVGTFGGGLNRYSYEKDNFTRFWHDPKANNTLSNNDIYSIVEDNRGNLWVGTENGLNRLNEDNSRIVNFYHDPDNRTSISTNAILALCFDSSNNLWVGGWNGTLQKYNAKEDNFKTFTLDPELPRINIWCIHELSDKSLAIGTYGQGLYIFNPETGKAQRYKYDLTPTSLLTNNIIRAVEEIDTLVLLVGTEFGVSIIDLRNLSVRKIFESEGKMLNVWDTYTSRCGMIWLANLQNGVLKMDIFPRKFEVVNTSTHPVLSENNILAFTEDLMGNVWIGTGNGLNKLENGQLIKIQLGIYKTSEFDFEIVHALTTDKKGNIWAGLYHGKGLFVIDPITHRIINKIDIPVENINVLFQDRWGIMWIGSTNSLSFIDPVTNKLLTFKHDPNKKTSVCKGTILSIFERVDGSLWIGTDGGGLCRFDRNSMQFEQFLYKFGQNGTISSNTVYCMVEDDHGNLWIGTSSGLNLWDDKSYTFTTFSTHNHLPTNAIYGMLIDTLGFFWISSNKGIFKYNHSSYEVFLYGIIDGLQGLSYNSNTTLKTSGGVLFFGGSNGFNYFDPYAAEPTRYISKPVFTGLLLDAAPEGISENGILTRDLNEISAIKIPPRYKGFTIEYICPAYSNAEKYQYAYKLEGFDTEYQYVADRRFATYTNLSPGTYIFKLKAANNDLKWSEQISELKIIILPIFYNTIWFRSLIISAFFMLSFAVIQLKRRENKKQRLYLEKLVDTKTTRLNEANQALKAKTFDLENTLERLIQANQLLNIQKNEISDKSLEIKRLNQLLQDENIKLTLDKNQLLSDKIQNKIFSYAEFSELFPDDESCLKYLDKIKWEKGFKCRKCKSDQYKYLISEHHLAYSRRCTYCQHIESPLIRTIFHNIKFPVKKAFYIFFSTLNGKKQSLDSLSEEIALRKQTCWSFRNRVIGVLKSHDSKPNKKLSLESIIIQEQFV